MHHLYNVIANAAPSAPLTDHTRSGNGAIALVVGLVTLYVLHSKSKS